MNWTWSWGDGATTKTTGSAANGTSTATHAWNAAGHYSVHVNVSDGHNPAVQSLPIYINVTLDSTPPVTVISLSGLGGNEAWYIGPVTATLSAADMGSGVALTDYRIDSGAWQTYLAPFVLQTQGNHTVDYRSTDRAGNVETAHTATVAIDSLAPTVSIQTPVNGSGVTSSSVDLIWIASDSGSGVASVLVSVDGGIETPVTGSPAHLPALADGRHTVLLRATDAAGNTATTNTTFTVQTGILGLSLVTGGGLVAVIIAVAAVAAYLGMRRRRKVPPAPPPPTPPSG